MKKKIIWTFIVVAAFVVDHYTVHYVSGTDAKTLISDSIKTTIVIDSVKKVIADTTKKAVATSTVAISK